MHGLTVESSDLCDCRPMFVGEPRSRAPESRLVKIHLYESKSNPHIVNRRFPILI